MWKRRSLTPDDRCELCANRLGETGVELARAKQRAERRLVNRCLFLLAMMLFAVTFNDRILVLAISIGGGLPLMILLLREDKELGRLRKAAGIPS